MRSLLFILPLLALLACNTQTEKGPLGNDGTQTGLSNDSTDLNSFRSNTLFDSLTVEKLPYCDSINMETFLPIHKTKLNPAHIELLKLRDLRVFREYDWPMPDSVFTAVCRLKLSKNYYSVIINYNGENETMNYLINYDREFKVIDYLETAYDELVESALRTYSGIDSTSITVRFSNILSEPALVQEYVYQITDDGFFRERIADK
jgi:hypothetical protein